MLTWIMKVYTKALFVSIVIGFNVIIGYSFLQASELIQKEVVDIKASLPKTAWQDLRYSGHTIQDIKYQQGEFPAEYDTLAKIGVTPCYGGEDEVRKETFSVRYGEIPISAIMVEDEKTKIVDPSPSYEQRILYRNADRRTQIAWPMTQEWPYRVHGHLIMKFPDGTFTGTGILVGPNHVLTAGHNLYNILNNQWAYEVLFAPGRHEDQYPFGDYKGCLLLTHEKWVREGKEKYDIGMVVLDSSIGEKIGWLGLLSLSEDLLKEWPVVITGYPGDKGAGTHYSSQMWGMGNNINKVMDGQLYYDIDTWEGQSGSAVWGEYPDYKGYYTVGIHTYKAKENIDEGNRGTTLSKNKFEIILEWLKTYQLKSLPLSYVSAAALEISYSLAFLDLDNNLKMNYESWMNRAKEDNKEALYHIGTLYFKGESIKKDDNKAFACFYEAAKEGYVPALVYLGVCYEEGRGTNTNVLKAVSLYQQVQAAIKDNANVRHRLGLLYLEGKGLPQKIDTARLLLKEACDYGDGEACYHLARSYDETSLITHNKEKAKEYYQLAEKHGYQFSRTVAPNQETGISVLQGQNVYTATEVIRSSQTKERDSTKSPSPSSSVHKYDDDGMQARIVKGQDSYERAKYLVVKIYNSGCKPLEFESIIIEEGKGEIPENKTRINPGKFARMVFEQKDDLWSPVKKAKAIFEWTIGKALVPGCDAQITLKGEKGTFTLNAKQPYCFTEAGYSVGSIEYRGEDIKITKEVKCTHGKYHVRNGLIEFTLGEN